MSPTRALAVVVAGLLAAAAALVVVVSPAVALLYGWGVVAVLVVAGLVGSGVLFFRVGRGS